MRILLTFLFCVLFEIPVCQGNNEVENSKSENDSISIVVINGLVRTKEKTIFREINFESGKKLFSSNSLIESWELRISSLSLFMSFMYVCGCKKIFTNVFYLLLQND